MSILFLGSCSKEALDKVNFNKNNPIDVQAKFILTDVITSTSFNVVGSDLPMYASIYIEHEGGVWNQAFNAEMRVTEPTASSTYDNSWGSIYNNIKNLKIAIAKTSAGGSEEGNNVTCGIAKILLAYNLGVLTDLYGDVPFSQSGVMNEDGTPKFLQPVIEKQSDLYPQIQGMLDSAILLLQGGDKALSGPMGSQDLIYGGNAKSWTMAAYGLKARYLMHTLKVSADKNGDLAKIVQYVDMSFKSAADEMLFNIYNGTSAQNPLYGISSARDMLGASRSLALKFKALNDPRGDQVFMDYDFAPISLQDAIADGVPNGNAEQVQFTYPISIAEYAPTAPTEVLSFHEIMFLKAEALVRLGKPADAREPLQAGILAAFANLNRTINSTNDAFGLELDINLTPQVAAAYIKNQVLPRFAANPLKETMLQKYLAFYGASGESLEAYNDYRRLLAMGESALIGLENPLDAQGKFPLRFAYGNSDVLANQNIKTAYGNGAYVYTDNVWWAGGTR